MSYESYDCDVRNFLFRVETSTSNLTGHLDSLIISDEYPSRSMPYIRGLKITVPTPKRSTLFQSLSRGQKIKIYENVYGYDEEKFTVFRKSANNRHGMVYEDVLKITCQKL